MSKSAPATPNFYHRRLGALLAVSYGLRVWLACRGGELFWPDENRYGSSEEAVDFLRHARWSELARLLLGHADHLLFRWFGLPSALLGSWVGLHLPLVAAYFGLFSVLSIYLVWAVARRTGAGEAEALWAAYLAACANSLFFYSRHFFPYDISLCAMLGALWLALGAWSWGNSLAVGVAASVGFLVYSGNWLLGGCVLILHSLLGDGGRHRFLARAACSAAGLVLPLLVFSGLGAALGYNLVSEDYQWAILNKGDFHLGYRVIAGFLWEAEGGLLAIWLLALAYALTRAWKDGHWGRLTWHVGGLLLVLGGLLLLSDVIPRFTIQGRRVREFVPFLCLAGSVGLARFVEGRARRRAAWVWAIALVTGACAAWNFSGPLRQVFPDRFERLAAAAAARQTGYPFYRLVSLRKTMLGGERDDPWPGYRPILRRPHPLQYRPYQYEGYNAAQRADFDRRDIAMQLLGFPGRWTAPASRWQGYPGPVRLVVRLPAGATGTSEPLVVTGRTGRGDLFYLHYADASHLSFGLDHWGVHATNSSLLAVDYSRPHEIILFAGFLLPPAESPPEPRARSWLPQRARLGVLLDGKPVFSMSEDFYPASRTEISFGVNFIGGSTAGLQFTGQVLEFGSAPDSARAAFLSPPPGGPAESGPTGRQ